jgi:hypothetical protein
MKKLLYLFITFTSILISSCEGPQGPPGRDGGIIVSQAFEIEIDFNAGNNYEYIEPYGFQVFPTDVTLVYILWEIQNGQEIWRLLPQNVEFIDGTLTYNFDFTQVDVRFFLDGTVDFNFLDPSWTQNQVFRVVVVPADNVGKLSYSDINTVIEAFNIKSFEKR